MSCDLTSAGEPIKLTSAEVPFGGTIGITYLRAKRRPGTTSPDRMEPNYVAALLELPMSETHNSFELRFSLFHFIYTPTTDRKTKLTNTFTPAARNTATCQKQAGNGADTTPKRIANHKCGHPVRWGLLCCGCCGACCGGCYVCYGIATGMLRKMQGMIQGVLQGV